MAEDALVIPKELTIPGWELWFTATASGGPGGQHANRANTAVTLHWSIDDSSVLDGQQKARLKAKLKHNITDEGVLQVSSADTRSQHRNRKIARQRMAEQVGRGLKKKKRRKRTKPSRAARRRRLKNKRHRSKIKKMRKSPRRDDW